MNDVKIISTQLLIEYIEKSHNSRYLYLKANHKKLVNYVKKIRLNRLIQSLFTMMKMA